jgi:ABC-type thiamin/hydroxymethylpyrimidine transport system permease subunit
MKERMLRKFTVFDLTIMAVMATIGIAIKPVVVPLAHFVSGPLMMPSGAFAGGLYMMWIVIGYGIVRKPGTATLISLVQALIVMLSGMVGSHGVMSIFTYVTPGLVVDLFFIISGHRACCRGCCIIAGALANITGTACVNIVFFRAPGAYLILILAVAALSGCAGGWMAWELIKAMKKYRVIKQHTEDEEKKRVFSLKKFGIAALVVLVAAGSAAGVYYYTKTDTSDSSGYSVTVEAGGNAEIALSRKQLEKMDPVTVKATIVSSSSKDETGTFTGVPVKNVLAAVGENMTGKYKTFVFTSGDGYSAALSAKEINNVNDVLIVYKKNGKYLQNYNEGGAGPLRLLVLSDSYGNRSVKYLVKVTCKK